MSSLYVPTRRLIYTTLGFVSRLLRLKEPDLFILCYHGLDESGWDFSISPIQFKKQIEYLLKSYDFLSLSDVADIVDGKKKVRRPSVVITFDDGYKNILSARAFLRKHKIHPTVFVIADSSRANRKQLGTDAEFLSVQDLRDLSRDGWEIGSHTMSHPDMEKLDKKKIETEVVKSKKILEHTLALQINDIAFPKGRYTEEILRASMTAGYRLALTMEDGVIVNGTDRLRIPRIGVDGTHSFTEFTYLWSALVIQIRAYLKGQGYGK